MNNLTRQINSMFILGYKGETPNKDLEKLSREGLGGIIFFSKNILDREKFKQTVKYFKNLQEKIILSIDQEGGRVQRTSNLPDKIEYLSPIQLIKKPESKIKEHYKILSDELLNFGINMNFAPVLDIFTNPNDPIINIRAFGKTPKEVVKYSQFQNNALQKNGIKTVGKHFPGHGGADVDSHLDMPQIHLNQNELSKHIEPFTKIKTDAIMVAHVHYSAFDEEIIPASLSKNVINYLKNDLSYKGLIISDDMVMGGISKHFSPLEACIKGIKAGIDVFIFREYNYEVKKLLSELEIKAQNDKELNAKIKSANSKIEKFKSTINQPNKTDFEPIESIKKITNIISE